MERMRQEVKVKGVRWAEEIRQRWRQPKGEDRTGIKKEATLLRCTLLSGSAWGTEKKYMRRYKCTFEIFFGKGKCDIFFGIEHRLRKEDMVEHFNREAKEGWRLAAVAARITDERVSTRRLESLWQSTVTWEQLLEKKKEQWHRSQATRVQSPRLW